MMAFYGYPHKVASLALKILLWLGVITMKMMKKKIKLSEVTDHNYNQFI